MRGKFKYIISLFIICMCMAFLLSSSLFDIRNIYVYGNKQVSKDEMIKYSTIGYGTNIFRINKKHIMKEMFNCPYIKMIKITRTLPDTVNIHVVEREAMALVPYVGSYLNIDEEGIILQIDPSIKKAGLPVVKGMKFDTFKIGEPLAIDNKAQLDITIKIINELKTAALQKEITEINVTNADNILLQSAHGIKVELGNASDTRKKIIYTKAILEDLIKKKLRGTIEISHGGNPVFKPE